MKVSLSVDMEGVAGVTHPDPTRRDSAAGPRGA